MVYDITIIGGGVIGCSIARELSKYKLKILLLEKELDVAEGISKANSGVLHAGFNVKPGSLKARFNVEGLGYFPSLTNELGVPYRLTKKLVVAKNDKELPHLEKLLSQGKKNKCQGLSLIQGEQIRAIEPLVQGKYALLSEKTAILSPYEFTIALAENALANGAEMSLGSLVTGLEKKNNVFHISIVGQPPVRSRLVVNAAGLFSDIIGSLAQENGYQISPCRGEYFVLDVSAGELLKTAVYPVPPEDGRGLGIHLTPTIHGNILLGPSAEYIEDREDVGNAKEILEQLKKETYELLPELQGIPIIKSYAGLRPKLFRAGLDKVSFADFVIFTSDKTPGFIHLTGIESPGLTSAPAIAKYVAEDLISKCIDLKANPDFTPIRNGIKPTNGLSFAQKKKAFSLDPSAAEIICRCSFISRNEIEAAIENPLGSKTLNAIKKRTHSMMGRCQGGFCLPKIIDILCQEKGLLPQEILKGKKDGPLLMGDEK